MKRTNTKRLVINGLLVVSSVILTRILSIRLPIFGVESVRIGFGTLPIIMAGFLFGPIDGFVVGMLADLFGYWINPMGPFMPHFTITSGLHGMIPGLLFVLFKRKTNFWVILVSSLGSALVGLTLTPYFINSIWGVPYSLLMPPRIISAIIKTPIYALIIKVIFDRIPGIKGLILSHET